MRAFFTLGVLVGLLQATNAPGADSPGETNTAPHFTVETYDVEGGPKISMDAVFPILSKYTGTNVSLSELAEAAFALQAEYPREGYPMESVAISAERITNGIVTMNVFQAATPQIIISGTRFFSPTSPAELPAWSPPPSAAPHPTPELTATNAPPPPLPPWHPPKPATPEQLVAAAKLLSQQMAKTEAEENDLRIHVVSTNSGPRFNVEHYVVTGNSVLTPQTIAATLTNIDGAFGTNVSFEGVKTAVEQLQQAYHDRGYVTAEVTLPRQTLANATVKMQVLEGRLANIEVVGNRYFSSNNVMRSLPSLHTNMVLNGPVFNAELNRANANQDRQIYPVIGPGPEPGTSDLTLKVKDRLPLHSKVELDNQNSPGTPDLRVNASAVDNNLWQDENALGVQYGFSPELYKQEQSQWPFYDEPDVDYYSGFYRLPLGNPESIGETVASNPSFGYNEATRQFRLPPPTGQPQLTFYANRAAIDAGVQPQPETTIETVVSSNSTTVYDQQLLHKDVTVNQDLGFQLSESLPEISGIQSALSGGMDLKVYFLTSYGTNVYSQTTYNTNGQVINSQREIHFLANTDSRLEYLPLSLNYNANFQDAFGPATFGLSLSVDLWYSAAYNDQYPQNTNVISTSSRGLSALTNIVGSTQSSGHWVILKPSFSQQFQFYTNWITTFRADGQWSSEPLVSIEQFGAGGVNSVVGYHEGEVFGDEGWHVGLEQDTPTLVVGDLFNGAPLSVRASVYMDYARVYLINASAGSPSSTPLSGVGFGVNASAGATWQAQFLCSWPLLNAGTVQAYQPFFDFDLTAQF
ncbi:MAG TPA: POTRA domain-containing protein [Verrucomicrobiae bacterium]|nr:POTRA domain-containing protein [Verrucomicrobiae bacterium]